ncbi:MAG TPA: hypothetical protein VMD51_02590 [Mycobacterium sp.]|nr:hypothetical protein [Mycobacterium sp.]
MTTFASAPRLLPVAERSDARLDGAVAVRRCAQYRKAFRWAAVSYPVDVLSLDAPSAWIRRHGVSVDVGDGDELETALSAGVDPLRVIMHQSGPHAAPVRDVVDAGVGRVVVNSSANVAVLAATASRQQRVLIQVTDRPVEGLAEDVVASERLDLIGLHRHLTPGEPGVAAVVAMIAAMQRIAKQQGVIPARLSLADVDVADWGRNAVDLNAMSDAIGDAIETGCIAARFGRPAVNVSPSAAALVPGRQPAR